jgi:hypothetical protein
VRPRYNCVSLEGLDPSGQGTREFWIEKDLLQFFYKKGWMYKYLSAKLVKEVLESPAVIFKGLQREGQEEALCYAGLASCQHFNNGGSGPPPTGKTFVVYIFVVYIRDDDVVFRWDWEEADKNLTYPLGFESRFGSQLWPKT